MGFVRPLVLFLLVLIVVHLVARVWLRLRERRRLAEEWEAGAQIGDREGFMADGMADYDRSLRNRLLWLTVVGPMAALAFLLYAVNGR